MYSKIVPSKQLIPWMVAALIPVTLQLGAGDGWVTALLVAGVSGLIVAWVWHRGLIDRNSILATAQFIVIVLVLAQFLRGTAQAWPGDNYPAVPLILLAICVWTCRKGASVAARVGCVLFWVVLILYLLVMLTGVGGVKLSWLAPRVSSTPWAACVLLLLPSSAIELCDNTKRGGVALLVPNLFYIVGSGIVAGALSPDVVQRLVDPYYTMGQSTEVFGIRLCMDAIISAGMTVGWYALICLLLSAAAAWAEVVHPQMGKIGMYLAAVVSVGGVLCNLHISFWILVILATVFWVILPILTQGLVQEKKS